MFNIPIDGANCKDRNEPTALERPDSGPMSPPQ